MKIIRNFNVIVTKKEVVVAATPPTPEHRLPLSNLDLLLPAADVGVFFFYKKPSNMSSPYCDFGSMVSALKKALGEILVIYYTFSGEMVQNQATGEAELLCNNGGVQFIEAFADIELQEIDLYNPDESIEGKLVPKKMHGVLAVQVTELRCGGIVVGCTFDHRVADAYSTNMFLVSWAETAQSQPLSKHPSFCRSLLSPRRPGDFDKSVEKMYMFYSKPPPEDEHTPIETQMFNKVPISRIYYIKADQILELQLYTSSGKSVFKRTKLESFSAFLWKMIATKNAVPGCEKRSRLGIVVDGRTRLHGGDRNRNQENLMDTYFGNVLSISFGEKATKELNDMPLNSIANEVHKFIKTTATEDHFLGLIDYVEANRPESMASRIYAEKIKKEDEPAIVVSSGLHFPVRKIDFGWGKPMFGSYHFPWGGESGYVMPMPSATGNGDWIVYMHLPIEQIKILEETASHIFNPITPHYTCG